ncbi:MAG: S8 family serine peptidase [Halofilum sp. (in: g-proteobacteria)]|nr:S8 family serine peptidase [Halofilum sp. (in: g-proteobacteria)]
MDGAAGGGTRRSGAAGRCALALLLLVSAGSARAATADDTDPRGLLRQAIAAACEAPREDLAGMAARIPRARALSDEPLVVRGLEAGWRRRFAVDDGAELRVERFEPRGQLRRVSAEYWAPVAGDPRPRVAALAGPRCRIRLGRRLVYEAGVSQAVAIEYLDAGLEPTGQREPLNPPVPAGEDPGGVPVALVDAGVNYRLPAIGERLARDAAGTILGYDWWDMDRRPFDANPARSPFFPQRHGTRTASLLLREAPAARLVPYRYPRPDMGRMAALVEDAAGHGVVVVNLSLGSGKRAEWQAFARAARAHPGMLFVVSAGNNGRDIDARPVYPAALGLDNVITVTSAENDGTLAAGSNRGREAVDLMVPAERLRLTDFDGRQIVASGSSHAAVRVSALAARLLAKHPGWRAPELRAAIFARVLPQLSGEAPPVAQGFMPRPDKAEALPPLSGQGAPRALARHVIDAATLYPDGAPADPRATFTPTFAYVAGSGWDVERLRRPARRMAVLLGQCGLHVPRIDVRELAGPNVYRYFHERVASALAGALELPVPTVYFVRDTLAVNAYDAVAFGKANSEERPALRYTAWFTANARDPGIGLAHELVHLLMDRGDHVDTPGNLMRADTAPGNTTLTRAQCDAIVAGGRRNGLLASAAE